MGYHDAHTVVNIGRIMGTTQKVLFCSKTFVVSVKLFSQNMALEV